MNPFLNMNEKHLAMFVSQNVSNVGWMDDFRATIFAPSENGELACDRGNPIRESPTKCSEFRSRNYSNLLRIELGSKPTKPDTSLLGKL